MCWSIIFHSLSSVDAFRQIDRGFLLNNDSEIPKNLKKYFQIDENEILILTLFPRQPVTFSVASEFSNDELNFSFERLETLGCSSSVTISFNETLKDGYTHLCSNVVNFLPTSGNFSMFLNSYNVTYLEKVTSILMNCSYKPAKNWQNATVHTVTMEMNGAEGSVYCKIRLLFDYNLLVKSFDAYYKEVDDLFLPYLIAGIFVVIGVIVVVACVAYIELWNGNSSALPTVPRFFPPMRQQCK